ncbi:MAG: DUF6443 domain-containing protein, partial [Saprospiraceae bacterium]
MTKNRYIIILLWVFNLSANRMNGQGDSPGDYKFRATTFLQSRLTTPGSPEAASLGKYGDYKINTFTGLPSISIPLYAVQGSELNMSFSLNYDGGGIKVEQLPTWVGSGWNLNGGGVITRSVKGDPDLKANYFNYNNLINQNSNTPYLNLFTENDFLLKVATKEIETQPDIFYLNAGGQSAKFYFKADHSIVMSEAKDLLITPYLNSSTGSLDSFYVKDAMGVTFIFNIPESTTLYYNTDYGTLSRFISQLNFNSSWYLSKIINANLTESIEFNYFTESSIYNPNQYVNPNNFKSITYSHGFQSGGTGCPNDPLCPYGESPTENFGAPTGTTIANRRFLNEVILKKGSSLVERLKFSSSLNVLAGGGRKLDTLSCWKGPNANSRILNQIFLYDNSTNRLTLTQIQEKSPGGIFKEPYTFAYYSTTLPGFTSNAIDHWGYFNNALSNSNLIPAILCGGVNANLNFPNCQGMNNPAIGADRSPNEVYSKAGILTRIKFPTKGYTEFVWEGNRAIAPDLICGDNIAERLVGGLRIKEVNNYTDLDQLLTSKKYTYKFSNGICSGKLFYQPKYHSSSTFTKYAVPLTELCNPNALNGTRYDYTFSSSSTVPLGAIQGGLVGYSRVEESFIGKTVYNYKNYIPAFITWGLLEDLDIQDLGQLAWVEEFNSTGQKVHSMGYKYSLDVNEIRRQGSFYGLLVEPLDQQDNKVKLCFNGSSYSWKLNSDPGICQQAGYYPSKFIRRHYKISQDWVYSKEVSDTLFYYTEAGTLLGSVPKLISNNYNNINVTIPTEVVITNSDDKIYKKVTKFPHDVSNSALISKNIIAVPLQIENYAGSSLLYRSRIDYNTFSTNGLPGVGGTWLLPFKFYEQYSGGTDILRESIDKYDISGTELQEGHKEFDQPITLIYSHNNLLLAAKIQNANKDECAFTGFETTDAIQGGWSIGTIGNIQPDVDSKTGIGQYTGSGIITKSSLYAGKYILSYWLKNQTTALSNSGSIGITINNTLVGDQDPSGWRFVQQQLTAVNGAYLTINAIAGTSLDELRFFPFDGLMTTYTYDRNSRMLSGISNENSLPVKFEYDGLLRLTGIRNFDNNYLKTVEYNFKTSTLGSINNIKSREVLQDGITSAANVNLLSGANVKRIFEYYDDLGRPLQSIGVGQSATSLDAIKHHVYDNYGREIDKFLPFTFSNPTPGAYRSDALSLQSGFYASEGAFAKQNVEYENAPLNRVLKETPEGSAFNANPMKYSYSTNVGSEVKNFESNTYYPPNTLNKVSKSDENGNITTTYFDKLGLKVMESVSGVKTYFLYDGIQNIIQIIQPEGAELSGVASDPLIQKYSFLYTYDLLNRISSKKVPGSGVHNFIYDRLDREVLRIDPNGNKLYTKYDILGRVVLTGKFTGTTQISNSELLFETPLNSLVYPYYSNNQAFPTTLNTEILTIQHYDDYDWDDNYTNEVSFTPTPALGYALSNYAFVRGKLTGGRKGILSPNGGLAGYVEDYTFYDQFGREIQHKNTHHLGNTDISWKQYDFTGQVLKNRLIHNSSFATNLIINQRFTYDHANRLINAYHQIGDVLADEKLISTQSYNERDELVTKTLGNSLQTLDYTYNIRKWLTKINDPAVSNSDLFSMRLYYNDPQSVMAVPGQFNGNIAMAEWRTGANWAINGGSRALAAYGYAYDGLNRLTNAKYSDYIGNYGSTNANRYNVANTYDKNGNILSMVRSGLASFNNYNVIDNLAYTYDQTNPNQLSSISDATAVTQGFRSGSSGAYTYDANGNMVSDASKGILGISYNHLNLPYKFIFSNGSAIEIKYDASGVKLSKITRQGSVQISQQDYVGAIEYHNSKLQSIYHSEGRVSYCDATQSLSITAPINGDTKSFKSGSIIGDNVISGNADVNFLASGNIQYLPGFQVELGSKLTSAIASPSCKANGYSYEYVLRDHLGNGRIYFTDYNNNGIIEESNEEILQEAHYDPWGYSLGGNWINNSATDNQHLYNGKELNEDFGLGLYDYGARWYDAEIGRMTSVDAKADHPHQVNKSPYAYSWNNPVNLIDPDGN